MKKIGETLDTESDYDFTTKEGIFLASIVIGLFAGGLILLLAIVGDSELNRLTNIISILMMGLSVVIMFIMMVRPNYFGVGKKFYYKSVVISEEEYDIFKLNSK